MFIWFLSVVLSPAALSPASRSTWRWPSGSPWGSRSTTSSRTRLSLLKLDCWDNHAEPDRSEGVLVQTVKTLNSSLCFLGSPAPYLKPAPETAAVSKHHRKYSCNWMKLYLSTEIAELSFNVFQIEMTVLKSFWIKYQELQMCLFVFLMFIKSVIRYV